jgi:hypothetical protein
MVWPDLLPTYGRGAISYTVRILPASVSASQSRGERPRTVQTVQYKICISSYKVTVLVFSCLIQSLALPFLFFPYPAYPKKHLSSAHLCVEVSIYSAGRAAPLSPLPYEVGVAGPPRPFTIPDTHYSSLKNSKKGHPIVFPLGLGDPFSLFPHPPPFILLFYNFVLIAFSLLIAFCCLFYLLLFIIFHLLFLICLFPSALAPSPSHLMYSLLIFMT